MQIGRLMGAKLKISPYLLIFLLFFAATGMLEQAASIFVIVLMHELAHTAASRAAGLEIREIELLPFGGVARLAGHPELDPRTEAVISWAGPLLNFLLAAAFMVFYLNPMFMFTKSRSLFFIEANLTLAFFNLIPALPLDGGRILRSRLTDFFGFRRATELAANLGLAAALVMAAVGTWLFTSGRGLQVSLLLVAGFLFLAAWKEKKMIVYAYLQFLNSKQADLERMDVMAVNYLIAFEDTSLGDVLKLFSPKQYHIVMVVNRRYQVVRRITEKNLLEAAFREGVNLPLNKVRIRW